ncbi:MAG: hypothetical protein JWO98_2966 [Frankiales bacterium]|nr:hypothetical protein [Frankiales bacterium]
MSYGHAERNLAAVRLLATQTVQLLAGSEELTPGLEELLNELTDNQRGAPATDDGPERQARGAQLRREREPVPGEETRSGRQSDSADPSPCVDAS